MNWIRGPVVLAAIALLSACQSATALRPLGIAVRGTPVPMFVADLSVDLTVRDVEAARQKLDFVEELGGYVSAVGVDDRAGTERMTVELRVPHRYTGVVAETLSNEFGEVTFINVLSGEVSVRHARLQRQLAALQASLGSLSGAELIRAKDQIDLVHDIIAFQLRRTEFLYVVVRLTQAR